MRLRMLPKLGPEGVKDVLHEVLVALNKSEASGEDLFKGQAFSDILPLGYTDAEEAYKLSDDAAYRDLEFIITTLDRLDEQDFFGEQSWRDHLLREEGH